MPDAAAQSVYGLTSVAAQMAMALLLLLAVIFVAFWLIKRFGPRMGLAVSGKNSGLKFLGQLPLGPKRSLVLVRFLNKVLVLGVTEHSINLITEIDESHDRETDFANALSRADPPGGSP
ncbi:flagellar biosynthetic protein FliO [Desulfolutivibrio sulfoxidireducens]|uniref:flagellar biosynthetic protein FliO n=1 Tax=Desulfolutivibrio sulfoxidireducens TaxID=2773299 RepID=UPI001FE64AB6|nr:flagellar biosynthetic protein FliO [Desulfolutivibrio sulfoxidireducens]